MRRPVRAVMALFLAAATPCAAAGQAPPAPGVGAGDWWKPYAPPCVERENVFEFAGKPAVRNLGEDRYEIAFAARGCCDATVSIVDPAGGPSGGRGTVVRHLASGVLGPNAPAPFQKGSLRQTLLWNGKDDLGQYVREPGKLRVRVSLGLRPAFEKRLGGTSPYNMPGILWGLAASPEGVFVFSLGDNESRLYVRHFGHDGAYVKSLVPPPANLPESKLDGLGYMEYEPGKRAVHARRSDSTISMAGNYLTFKALAAADCQPVVSGDRIYFCDSGRINEPERTTLYWIHTDGSSDTAGADGVPATWAIGTPFPRLAASPDGKSVYVATGAGSAEQAVFRVLPDAERDGFDAFVGSYVNPAHLVKVEGGPENLLFKTVAGIDCDAQGRIYVADQENYRIQVFSPEKRYLKTIPIDRPQLVQVHRRTGAIYVLHRARVGGATVDRLTKLASFDDPREEYHLDGPAAASFALDSWSGKPRLWMGGGGQRAPGGYARGGSALDGVVVYEEDGGTCRKVLDFDEAARKADGDRYIGRWPGGSWRKIVCDPVRNRAYVMTRGNGEQTIVDLDSGAYAATLLSPGAVDDIAFDKRGYLHCHFNPGLYMAGVARLDPSRATEESPLRATRRLGDHADRRFVSYPEVPYDYGVGEGPWRGIIPVRDQAGAKGSQDGIGVTMGGEVAVVSNIYYVPKNEGLGAEEAVGGLRESGDAGADRAQTQKFAEFMRRLQEQEKLGAHSYFIRPVPGIPLAGGTVWTYARTGELRAECAAIAGDLVNGSSLDEDGGIRFVNARTRMVGGYPFLADRGGTYGQLPVKANYNRLTGTLIRGRAGKTWVLLNSAPVPLSEAPERPADLMATDYAMEKDKYPRSLWAWVEGADWLYAGASPIAFPSGFSYSLRFHTDWYGRTFVPEAYRHSIGALDANGNLILHIGRYGNLDSGDGPGSRIPVGGDGIAMSFVCFVGGTDDRLVFEDHGERIVVLRLDYHAEETVPIPGK